MKTIKNIILLVAIAVIAAFTSCGGKDAPAPVVDPTQEVIDGLSKAWTITSVTLDNADVTADWNGFSLTFDSSKGYSATELNSESILVWPASGSYSFPNVNNANLVERNDGVQITISNLTENSATLTFSINGRNGRTSGLVGQWVFLMGN